jgi:predicted nicotinamide N-methyase
LLDKREWVAGKRVLDFAAGSGLSAIGAAMAGAEKVSAVEIDDFAAEAIAMNAELNRTAVDILCHDLIGRNEGWNIVLAGDVCYERPMAERVIPWLRNLAGAGVTVLMGDPGRAYLPSSGLVEVARYAVPTSKELEDREMRDTRVLRLMP